MRSKLKAFTLVELLVVIGIIALLISILLPSLNNARRAATAVKCLSNLKMIGVAVNMYANDNKGAILPCDVQFKSNGTVREYWPMLLCAGKYLPVPQTNGNDLTPVANSVFMCPAGRMAIIQSINNLDVGNANQHFDLSNAAATATTPDGGRRRAAVLLGAVFRAHTSPLPSPPNNGFYGGGIIDCNYAINASPGPRTGATTFSVTATPYVDQQADQYLPSQSITVVPGSNWVSGIVYKMQSFKRAANVPLIMDGFGDALYNTASVAPNYIWRITGARHGQRYTASQPGEIMFKTGTTNVLFLDGHAEAVARDRLPYAAGGGAAEKSGKTQMLCSSSKAGSIQTTEIIWNLRQQ